VTALAEAPLEEQLAQAPNLLLKLIAVQAAVGTVEKDGENTFHHYSYVSIEGIVLATRDALIAQKILILASEESTDERQRQTREGEATVTTVHLNYTIIDAETGEKLVIPWLGRGEDAADKGVSKALTDARKTFLIQQLNIARGDDTEADDSTDRRGSGSGSGGGGAVNMIADAKGLSDAQLNHVLVSLNLPAAQKPFGAFTRIPAELEGDARAKLQELRDAT
jgi:hypothetical protein